MAFRRRRKVSGPPPMPEKNAIRVPTKIQACCDTDSTRYAFGGVRAMPLPTGVILAATDARCLAVVEAEGHVDKPSTVPVQVMSTAKTQRQHPLVFRNGEWRNAFHRYGAEIEGRFPTIGDVMPDISKKKLMRVSVDVDLLAKVAVAVNKSGSNLAMFFEVGADGGIDATAPVILIGSDGSGMVMPLAEGASAGDEKRRYSELRTKVKAAGK